MSYIARLGSDRCRVSTAHHIAIPSFRAASLEAVGGGDNDACLLRASRVTRLRYIIKGLGLCMRRKIIDTDIAALSQLLCLQTVCKQ
jgi:hypothetical protein